MTINILDEEYLFQGEIDLNFKNSPQNLKIIQKWNKDDSSSKFAGLWFGRWPERSWANDETSIFEFEQQPTSPNEQTNALRNTDLPASQMPFQSCHGRIWVDLVVTCQQASITELLRTSKNVDRTHFHKKWWKTGLLLWMRRCESPGSKLAKTKIHKMPSTMCPVGTLYGKKTQPTNKAKFSQKLWGLEATCPFGRHFL